MSKTYTITFDEKKKRYRLTPETGRVILVRADNKKFEWLKSQEKGKIVKISDSGRWTSSKDYDGLYDAVKSLSQEKIVDNTSSLKVTKAKSAKNKGDIKKSESGFIDVIRCDEIEYLVWEWQPSGEEKSKKKAKTISYGSCLRVKDGELAIFVYKQKNGENQDVIIGPHDQTIKTENFPILTSIVGTAFGGESPFQAEIYFISLSDYIKIPLYDLLPVYDYRLPRLHLLLNIQGNLLCNITDYKVFTKLNKLSLFELEDFKKQVEDTMKVCIKLIFENFNTNYEGIPILQIERKIIKLNDEAEAVLRKLLDQDFGINLKSLDISSLKIDKNSDNYKKVKALYIPTKEKPNNDAEAERAKSILGYHEVNLIVTSAIHRFVEADLTSENVDLNIDPKSEKWPITEKVTCSNCKGIGKIVSFSIESKGFMNLIKKEVRTDSVCSNCNGVGYIEKKHYPYRFEKGEYLEYSVTSNLNFDLVAKEILNKFIAKGEFTKSELLSFLSSDRIIKRKARERFEEKYLDNLCIIRPHEFEPLDDEASWSYVKTMRFSNMLNMGVYLLENEHVESFIVPLFKTQIIDNGTKRRPKKDDNIYYKFTNKAKKLYEDL
jgi:membrane protease subunit (stomatin/prohibitin family)